MPVLIGTLLDVSGSMRRNIDETNESWARCIFDTLDQIISNEDISDETLVFALCFGGEFQGSKKRSVEIPLDENFCIEDALFDEPHQHTKGRKEKEVFDLLRSLESTITPVQDIRSLKKEMQPIANELEHLIKQEYENRIPETISNKTIDEIIEASLEILFKNGAPFVRKWANIETLKKVFKDKGEVEIILFLLDTDEKFRNSVVWEVLPNVCRSGSYITQAYNYCKATYYYCIVRVKNFFENGLITYAPEREIREIKIKILDYIPDFQGLEKKKKLRQSLNQINEEIDELKLKIEEGCCKVVPCSAVTNVHQASYILKTVSGIERKEKLTEESIDKLMKTIEPYIYGGTPMYRTLHLAKQILAIPDYEEHKKLVIIVSDGEPADKDIYDRHLKDDITVVCCFVTENPISNALHFYAEEQAEWEKGAKFMFNLSSKIPLQNIPNVVFADKDWTFDFSENNDTKLFAQVNHPDMIDKMCQFAQDLVFCQDSLSEVISTVDVYINQTQFELQRPTNQGEKPTCYAHAAAAVIHLATTRIVGRNYNLDQIRKDILEQFTPEGCKGADTAVVLENVCPKYGLRVKKVSLKDAKIAISEKRPVLARIAFNENTIGEFYNFFLQSKSATLSKENYTICDGKTVFGHAVVFVGYNSKSLRFMNTWGCEWGDNGFFRVKDVDVFDICEFYDVYFDETDLTTIEKEAFKDHGKELTRLHLDKLKSLKEATHTCHLCHRSSKVLEYTGEFNKVQCPKCRKTFKAREGHPDIFLAIYLTSLAHTEQR